MDQVIRKQSEMCAMFEEHNRSLLKILLKDIHELATHLVQLKKIQNVDSKTIETMEEFRNSYEEEIRSIEHTISSSINAIALNRVYLNHGNLDIYKYGIFDGWPGTYWISKAQTKE